MLDPQVNNSLNTLHEPHLGEVVRVRFKIHIYTSERLWFCQLSLNFIYLLNTGQDFSEWSWCKVGYILGKS